MSFVLYYRIEFSHSVMFEKLLLFLTSIRVLRHCFIGVVDKTKQKLLPDELFEKAMCNSKGKLKGLSTWA